MKRLFLFGIFAMALLAMGCLGQASPEATATPTISATQTPLPTPDLSAAGAQVDDAVAALDDLGNLTNDLGGNDINESDVALVG
jgi:PBP1b-binding outer membrane lipoprotein LpoB